MESDRVDGSIYKAFTQEFIDYRKKCYIEGNKKSLATWSEFINSLSSEIGITMHNNMYQIVDRKKWFLTKIKYGI